MYKVIKTDKIFELLEIKTEHVLQKARTHKEIFKAYRFFKEGGGFSGWTPQFILQDKTEKYILNL